MSNEFQDHIVSELVPLAFQLPHFFQHGREPA
jgi:hypothetical protein